MGVPAPTHALADVTPGADVTVARSRSRVRYRTRTWSGGPAAGAAGPAPSPPAGPDTGADGGPAVVAGRRPLSGCPFLQSLRSEGTETKPSAMAEARPMRAREAVSP